MLPSKVEFLSASHIYTVVSSLCEDLNSGRRTKKDLFMSHFTVGPNGRIRYSMPDRKPRLPSLFYPQCISLFELPLISIIDFVLLLFLLPSWLFSLPFSGP